MVNLSPYKIIKNIALFTWGAVFFYACTNKNSLEDWHQYNASSKPEIIGKNIEIKESKNGRVQFRAIIPKVIEKHKDNKPYIYICPKGIHLWQYDTISKTKFELTADSAYIIEPQQYYELWGNVTIERKIDSTFAVTKKLFIEQEKNLIHTNSPVVINKFNQIKDAIASGFQSDLAFQNPTFYNITQGEVNYQDLQLRKRKTNSSLDTLENENTNKQ